MDGLVIVLGMHRSGTSFLMAALQAAGLYLGPELMDAPNAANVEGFFEAWEAVRINDRILAASGGSWDRVPVEVHGDPETSERIERFLQELRSHTIAGWKDPRTTLTFPVWQPHLTQYQIVACFRHPLSVAKSLQVRDEFPWDRGLELWAQYNEHLLQTISAEDREVLWCDFDLPGTELQNTVLGIVDRLGLSTRQVDQRIFNPYLRHQAPAQSPLTPRIQDLYDRLKEQASRQRAASTIAPLAATGNGTTNDLKAAQHTALDESLAHLAHVQHRYNEILQLFERSVQKIQAQVSHTSNVCRAIILELQDVQVRLNKVERRVFVNALARWWRKLRGLGPKGSASA
jgi:hypothetical protein